MIHYSVRCDAPHTHTLDVRVRFEAQGDTRVHLPSWTPGSYLLREFGRYVSRMRVTTEAGEAIDASQTAKGSWAFHADGPVEVAYRIYGHELTVRTPHVDGTHAFFTGTNACVFVDGRTDEPCTLQLHAPDGWETFCPLDRDAEGAFVAPDYDVLADTIVELGPHRSHTFDVLGVPHHLVFWGADDVALDLPRLERDVRAIVEVNAAIFDGALPYEHYLFVFHITDKARGGLEHLNATALATPWRYFETDEGYRSMLGLIAHEHFHTWNVKRIRPVALGPFDYLNENYSTGLWVAEGFTSYFDNLVCLRAGCWTRDEYLAALQRDIRNMLRVPGRFEQSIADASYDAWIRLYRPDEDTPNRTVSYYLKGSIAALALDLHVRGETRGERSLVDVMRWLWARFQATGEGFTDDDMRDAFREACGVDVDAELDAWVFGTEDPPLAALFASHGIAWAAEDGDQPYLGLRTSTQGQDLVVKHVLTDGPNAGTNLYAGDVLVAVDGRRITPATWSARCDALVEDHAHALHVFRRGRLVETELRAAPDPGYAVNLAFAEESTDAERALLEEWLAGSLS